MRDPEPQANINTKYIVEDVEIRGVPDRAITPEMRADLQALTGKPLDSDEAERLETRLKSAFPDYNVDAPDEPREPARPDQGGLPPDADRSSRDGCASSRWRRTPSITRIRAGAPSCRSR